MKNIFEINNLVTNPLTNEKIIVRDYELIDNEYIYYFDNLVCFPENMLKPKYFDMLKKLLSLSKEDKDKYKNQLLEGLDEEISSIMKKYSSK